VKALPEEEAEEMLIETEKGEAHLEVDQEKILETGRTMTRCPAKSLSQIWRQA
jgi:hypothetical protein